MRRPQDLIPRSRGPASPDIFQQTVLEQLGILEHESHHLHQISMGNLTDVHTTDFDCPFLHIIETGDQAGRSALTRARVPYKSGGCPCFGGKVQMRNSRVICIFVCKGHIFKGDIVALRMLRDGCFRLRLRSQDHVNAPHGFLRLHFVAGHIHDLVEHNRARRGKNQVE